MAATTYVALLRGINIGSNNRLAMADLRTIINSCGYENCRTLLNSGNVVFSGPKQAASTVEKRIESAIVKQLAMNIRVLVRTADELAATIEANPLSQADKNGSKFFVLFLDAKPKANALASVELNAMEQKEVGLVDRALYLWCADGLSQSRLGKFDWGKALGVTTTARNWNTVNKLQKLMDQPSP